jgi:hypothetical protein
MSRKVLKQKFRYEAEEEEEKKKEKNKEISKTNPPGQVPWSNPNRVPAKDRNAAIGGLVAQEGLGIESPDTTGSRRVTPTRGPVISAGAAPLVSDAHHHYFTEEIRPGAVRVTGLGYEEGFEDDEYTVDVEQATLATREESISTVKVIARVVDTEEENRRLREQDRLRHERDQLLHERNWLFQMMDNAAVVTTPVVATNRDAKSGNEEVVQGGPTNEGDSTEGEDHKFGTRGRRWCSCWFWSPSQLRWPWFSLQNRL